jgi:hypothetical protein
MLGVITGAQNVSKGVITTTSAFAPKIEEDPYIKTSIPFRLELKARDQLLQWLDDIQKAGSEQDKSGGTNEGDSSATTAPADQAPSD